MAVIAISQQIGSRGIELGELAARELGYRFQTSEQLIAETAKRFNVSAEQMKLFDVAQPPFLGAENRDRPSRRVLSRRLAAQRLRKTGSSSRATRYSAFFCPREDTASGCAR